jgi:hypothetical protein
MPKSSKSKSRKKQVNVKDLSAAETELTAKQMKKVKGGANQKGLDLAAKSGQGDGVGKTGGHNKLMEEEGIY